MWNIVLSKKVEEELYLHLKLKKFDANDIKILKLWVSFVEEHGPDALASHYKWDDHPLSGKLDGCRSSCISNSGRIIYRVKDKEIIVEVLRVTPNHNYRFDEEF